MKKYVVLVAAFAMVAFAGCKKEEKGLVTLTVGVENEQNDAKQAYNEALNTVMFQAGDQIYLNEIPYSVSPLNGDIDPYTTTAASYKAQIRGVNPTAFSGQHFLAVYPVGANNIGVVYDDIEDIYSVNMTSTCTMIPQNVVRDGDLQYASTMSIQNNYRTWPLSNYYDCGDCFFQDGRQYFRLLNDVAVFTPSVIYGYRWLQRVCELLGETCNAENLPAMIVDKVEITTDDNHPISGMGYIADIETADPHVVLDLRTSNTLTAYADQYVAPIACQRSNQAEIYVGNIPVPPFYGDATVQMNTYFHITINNTTYHFKYTGATVNAVEGTVVRGRRTVLKVNLLDAAAENIAKISYNTTDLDNPYTAL